jgi:hypothetical protein
MAGSTHIRIGRVKRMLDDVEKLIFYRVTFERAEPAQIQSLLDTKQIIEMHFPELIKKVDN